MGPCRRPDDAAHVLLARSRGETDRRAFHSLGRHAGAGRGAFSRSFADQADAKRTLRIGSAARAATRARSYWLSPTRISFSSTIAT